MEENLVPSEGGTTEDDFTWVYQVIGLCKTEREFKKLIRTAPSTGAIGLLDYAMNNRNGFYDKYAFQVIKQRKRETQLRDDGRKRLEIFDQAYTFLAEKYYAQRECPMCGHAVEEESLLPPRPKESS